LRKTTRSLVRSASIRKVAVSFGLTTYVPAPCRDCTTPSERRPAIASRTTLRLTPKRADNTISVGMRSPSRSRPAAISAVIPAATREGDWGARMNVEIFRPDALPFKVFPSLSAQPRAHSQESRSSFTKQTVRSRRHKTSCQTTCTLIGVEYQVVRQPKRFRTIQ
jgi:hypothetical protein